MFKELKMYTVECDNCHKTSGHNSEYSCWGEKSIALEDAYESGWIEHERKNLCPECFIINGDDEIEIIKKDDHGI